MVWSRRKEPVSVNHGTRSAGRQRSFSRSFYPLLEQGSELATKWSALCDAHLSSGINDPIQVGGQEAVVEEEELPPLLRGPFLPRGLAQDGLEPPEGAG